MTQPDHAITPVSLVKALGGFDNIVELEPCITRLRVDVRNAELVNEVALEAAGAHGVVLVDTTVQVIVGPVADEVAKQIDALR